MLSLKDISKMRLSTKDNYIIMNTTEGRLLFSFGVPVCYFKDDLKIIVFKDYDYGITTKKHLNKFLGIPFKDVEARIKEKTIKYYKGV